MRPSQLITPIEPRGQREGALRWLPAAAPLGALLARLAGVIARVLALLEAPLHEARERDEDREEQNQDEAGVGDGRAELNMLARGRPCSVPCDD